MGDEELDETTPRRIRDFCKSIKVSEGLDRQIADELSAHMEDEIRAYLDGREKLTEGDALLLVEHHFGEPRVVRDLLQTVHCGLPTTSTARKLGAIVCLASALAGMEHLLLIPNVWRRSLFVSQWYVEETLPFDLAQMLTLTAAVFLVYYLISNRSRSGVPATASG